MRRDITNVLMVNNQNKTRNGVFKLEKIKFRREIGRNWFSNRVDNEWNRLYHI